MRRMIEAANWEIANQQAGIYPPHGIYKAGRTLDGLTCFTKSVKTE